MAKLKITRVRSEIGKSPAQRATLRHLGLHRMNMSVVREETPVVIGMVRKVAHLVVTEPAN